MHNQNGDPKPQFRDAFTPAQVCHLLRQEIISAKDLLLLWAIDFYTQNNEENRGCRATNAELASAIGSSSPTYVSGRLTHLQQCGLLLRFTCKEQRYLEVEWARTDAEREHLPGAYGAACRQAQRELLSARQ